MELERQLQSILTSTLRSTCHTTIRGGARSFSSHTKIVSARSTAERMKLTTLKAHGIPHDTHPNNVLKRNFLCVILSAQKESTEDPPPTLENPLAPLA